MHPKVRQDKPGLCPDCGMNLVPIKSKAGEGHQHSHESETFDKHAGHSTNIFKTKFWISLALSVPVVAYSDIVQKLLDWQAPVFTGSQYVPAILGSIIFFYGGWIFLASAYRELRAKLPGMMTLISLAILTAYIYSVYVVLTGGEHTLFWELSTLIVIMLLGHWVEMRAVTGAQGALKELSKLLPDTAEVIRDGKSIIIPLDEVVVGDIVLVKPGGKIPIDGEVIDGSSDVDESLATGESKPVAKLKGAEVIAGTVNGDGSLKIIVTKIGEHTFLAGVARLVAEAQASKSRLQLLSDRAAFYLTIVAVVTGGVTLASWLAASTGTAFAVERMVAVLVIACPHALGLAIPLVSSISTTKAARNGFLVKQRQALESARNIDTVLFDKTGTLTRGEYGVVGLWSNGITDIELLQFAASVNSGSEHVVAKAMLNRAQVQNVKLLPVSNFLRVPGKGVEAQVNGQLVRVGGEAMLEGGGINLPEKIQSDIVTAGKAGHTIIYVLRNKELLGVMALADVIREESRQAVADLKAMGIKVGMITGDSDEVAKWVAQELKITEYFAKVLPNQKTDKVKLLQANSVKVAMVGDGINDAPALTQADLGIAIGAGTNVAIESAGIILVKNDPRDIVKIIRLSKLTYVKMIQNLWWAAGYNIVAMPLAAGVLAFKGILLQPALAALFMSLSTVIVAFNALLLKRKQI
ncbi:TPA: heavy metal translocating P-type ATPase [Patescibacteria group bacterium]|nr:heavy metal translocating P-type ATPase [Patescibacteria group bacterium]